MNDSFFNWRRLGALLGLCSLLVVGYMLAPKSLADSQAMSTRESERGLPPLKGVKADLQPRLLPQVEPAGEAEQQAALSGEMREVERRLARLERAFAALSVSLEEYLEGSLSPERRR